MLQKHNCSFTWHDIRRQAENWRFDYSNLRISNFILIIKYFTKIKSKSYFCLQITILSLILTSFSFSDYCKLVYVFSKYLIIEIFYKTCLHKRNVWFLHLIIFYWFLMISASINKTHYHTCLILPHLKKMIDLLKNILFILQIFWNFLYSFPQFAFL